MEIDYNLDGSAWTRSLPRAKKKHSTVSSLDISQVQENIDSSLPLIPLPHTAKKGLRF